MESPENDKTVFRPSHKSWKSLVDCNGVLKIMPSDFHIPSATTATAKMTEIQNQKGHNPASPNLRTFRLILQLEKTGGRGVLPRLARGWQTDAQARWQGSA
jgi:hypothetical protein